MHVQTSALLLLPILVSAIPNSGPPKPAKRMSPRALHDCGCDIPSLFIQECQNIPFSASSGETESCVCSSQWYGYSDLCSTCLANADDKEEFPELVAFMEELVSATKQIYSACTLAGGSVSSDGGAVCAHTVYGDSCVSIAQDGKSGWASFEGSRQAKTKDVNVTAEFELGGFKPSYAGQKLDLPDSGYPKEEEEEKKDSKDKDSKDEDEEKEKTDEEDEELTAGKNATATTTTKSKGNSTTSSYADEQSPVQNVNGDSAASGLSVKGLGFAAVFGLGLAFLI